MPNQPPKQSAREFVIEFSRGVTCNHHAPMGRMQQQHCIKCLVEMLEDFATQERAEQKKKDAGIVRDIRQMKIHPIFQGLANPFVSDKPDISKDGWADLTKEVLQILASVSTAIERGE